MLYNKWSGTTIVVGWYSGPFFKKKPLNYAQENSMVQKFNYFNTAVYSLLYMVDRLTHIKSVLLCCGVTMLALCHHYVCIQEILEVLKIKVFLRSLSQKARPGDIRWRADNTKDQSNVGSMPCQRLMCWNSVDITLDQICLTLVSPCLSFLPISYIYTRLDPILC